MRSQSRILSMLMLILLAACSSTVGSDGEEDDGCTPTPLPYHDPLTQSGAIRDVHDPAMIKHGDSYYLFSTGHGIPIRRSGELIHWEPAGQVFTVLPSWVETKISGVEFPWAPDVAFFNDTYHLYYSLSTFGSQRSVIALATNKTLDPTHPDYDWVDQGPVVESRPGLTDFNAIDPNVAFDDDGQPWLAWGSFWGGIKMRRLDAETGLPSDEDDTIYALASRPVETAIEAPFIIRHGDDYYLFVSFDSCCRGAESTYKIMVGRAPHITGPYVDHDGVPMMQGGGTLVLASYGRIRGPGHNAVLTENDRHFLVHHFYDVEDGAIPKLQIRSLLWDEEGWSLAGEPYDGTFPIAPGDVAPDVAGSWGHSVDSAPPFKIELLEGGGVERCNSEGTWSLDGSTLVLRWSSDDASPVIRIERVIVSSDGAWYVGRTDDGKAIRGARLDASQPADNAGLFLPP